MEEYHSVTDQEKLEDSVDNLGAWILLVYLWVVDLHLVSISYLILF